MYEQQLTPSDLRRLLRIQSRETLWRYLRDERIPQPQVLLLIEEVTKGRVRLQDFLDPSPPKCARTIIDENGRSKVVLPGSKDWPGDPTPVYTMGTEDLSPPVRRAFAVLGGRVRYVRKNGRFFLDGRMSDLKRIMRAANEELRRRGEPPIPYPGVEPLE